MNKPTPEKNAGARARQRSWTAELDRKMTEYQKLQGDAKTDTDKAFCEGAITVLGELQSFGQGSARRAAARLGGVGRR